MVFSSLIFICGFLPLAALAYYLTPIRFRNLTLVVASLVFYGWGDPLDLLIVLVLIVINYFAGLVIDRAGSWRGLATGVAVALNLAVLIGFKYSTFLFDNISVVLTSVGLSAPPAVPSYLPLGISFIVFHVISYLIDVSRKTSSSQKSIVNFTLYITNFPQLIAGPIIRYHEISNQIEKRKVSLEDIDAGISRFMVGLAKKLLIANPIGAISDTVFALPVSSYSTTFAWIAIVCYTLQIYFDFSGYTDMAIGLARMFGFRFPENFNYPYIARSIQDFWRRWHMSLSRWFRDYLYIPLGGSRTAEWKTIRNLWIVFLLVGAWHGASWNFIAWGAWHGLFLSIERIPLFRRLISTTPAVISHAYTMGVVMIGWVFFRSENLTYAVEFVKRLFGAGPAPHVDMRLTTLISLPMIVFVIAAVVAALPIWPALRRRFEGSIDTSALAIPRAAGVVLLMLLAYASLTIEEIPPFIYFRF